MRRWFNWGPEPEPPRPPRRLTWPWRRLIRLPHLTLDNAKLASGGWIDNADSVLANYSAAELRVTLGEFRGIYFVEVEVR